jgi:hypothetical protein
MSAPFIRPRGLHRFFLRRLLSGSHLITISIYYNITIKKSIGYVGGPLALVNGFLPRFNGEEISTAKKQRTQGSAEEHLGFPGKASPYPLDKNLMIHHNNYHGSQ